MSFKNVKTDLVQLFDAIYYSNMSKKLLLKLKIEFMQFLSNFSFYKICKILIHTIIISATCL